MKLESGMLVKLKPLSECEADRHRSPGIVSAMEKHFGQIVRVKHVDSIGSFWIGDPEEHWFGQWQMQGSWVDRVVPENEARLDAAVVEPPDTGSKTIQRLRDFVEHPEAGGESVTRLVRISTDEVDEAFRKAAEYDELKAKYTHLRRNMNSTVYASAMAARAEAKETIDRLKAENAQLRAEINAAHEGLDWYNPSTHVLVPVDEYLPLTEKAAEYDASRRDAEAPADASTPPATPTCPYCGSTCAVDHPNAPYDWYRVSCENNRCGERSKRCRTLEEAIDSFCIRCPHCDGRVTLKHDLDGDAGWYWACDNRKCHSNGPYCPHYHEAVESTRLIRKGNS